MTGLTCDKFETTSLKSSLKSLKRADSDPLVLFNAHDRPHCDAGELRQICLAHSERRSCCPQDFVWNDHCPFLIGGNFDHRIVDVTNCRLTCQYMAFYIPTIGDLKHSQIDFSESRRTESLDKWRLAMVVLGRGETLKQLAAEAERLRGLLMDIERILEGIPLHAILNDATPILDRWSLGSRLVSCLVGLATGHPILAGVNRSIASSDVWMIAEDKTSARTLSRWYRLGRPAERVGLDV